MLCIGGLPPTFSMHYYLHFPCFCQAGATLLFFRERSACRLLAVTGAAALDVHMIRHTLVIAVINTFYRLTVDTDGMTWMRQRITERLSSLSLLRKALAAGAVTITGMLTSHHDVSLAAQTILIIGTIFHNTF